MTDKCYDYDDGCRCYDCGYRRGMNDAVDNAWRSTMAETQYQQIMADRDHWRMLYEELIKRVG